MAEKSTVFRKKSLNKASELDELNGYLKVSSIHAWVILAAAVMVVVGILIWGRIARVEDSVQGAGQVKDGILTSYFRQEDMDYIQQGSKIRVGEALYEVSEIVPKLLYTYDVPREILYLSQKTEWYQTTLSFCDLADGTYNVRVELGENTPLGFMRERN